MHRKIEELIASVKQPLLFFLPKSSIEKFTSINLNNFETHDVLNKLYIFATDGRVIQIKNDCDYLQILKKEKILKSNLFELIQLKSILDKLAFDFFINEYYKEVATWTFTTEIIKNEAAKHAKNYNISSQEYLNYQHNILKKHCNNVVQHFATIDNQPQQTNRILNLPTFNNKLDVEKSSTTTTPKSSFNKNEDKTLLKPTVKEIDTFLLKNVFSVNL